MWTNITGWDRFVCHHNLSPLGFTWRYQQCGRSILHASTRETSSKESQPEYRSQLEKGSSSTSHPHHRAAPVSIQLPPTFKLNWNCNTPCEFSWILPFSYNINIYAFCILQNQKDLGNALWCLVRLNWIWKCSQTSSQFWLFNSALNGNFKRLIKGCEGFRSILDSILAFRNPSNDKKWIFEEEKNVKSVGVWIN